VNGRAANIAWLRQEFRMLWIFLIHDWWSPLVWCPIW
jgi:hypothetical protein